MKIIPKSRNRFEVAVGADLNAAGLLEIDEITFQRLIEGTFCFNDDLTAVISCVNCRQDNIAQDSFAAIVAQIQEQKKVIGVPLPKSIDAEYEQSCIKRENGIKEIQRLKELLKKL